MKRSMKLLGLTFALACVSAGYAAASSSATEFYYGNGAHETITTTEPVIGTLSGKATFKSTVAGVALKLTTTTATSSGSLDNNASGGTQGHVTGNVITFTNVVVDTFTSCRVNSPGQPAGTVKTKELTGLAIAGPAVEFSPEIAGQPFVTLEFSGSGCPFAGVVANVTGSATGAAEGTNLKFTEGSSNLKLGANKATFEGTFATSATGRPLEVK